jgi:hypothetical protein
MYCLQFMIQSIPIETDLFFARPLSTSGGYTWTLTTRLGHMLRVAEGAFGPRDSSYTILGFEFAGEIPQIWYPGNCRHLVIQLTPDCATDLVRACYQISHECVHLLCPSGGRHATNLEEGLATYFALQYLLQNFKIDWPSTIPSYEAARAAAEQLLAIDATVIRRLREQQPFLYQVEPRDIVSIEPRTSVELAEFLCTPFGR